MRVLGLQELFKPFNENISFTCAPTLIEGPKTLKFPVIGHEATGESLKLLRGEFIVILDHFKGQVKFIQVHG
jgi:hypothetical protein